MIEVIVPYVVVVIVVVVVVVVVDRSSFFGISFVLTFIG